MISAAPSTPPTPTPTTPRAAPTATTPSAAGNRSVPPPASSSRTSRPPATPAGPRSATPSSTNPPGPPNWPYPRALDRRHPPAPPGPKASAARTSPAACASNPAKSPASSNPDAAPCPLPRPDRSPGQRETLRAIGFDQTLPHGTYFGVAGRISTSTAPATSESCATPPSCPSPTPPGNCRNSGPLPRTNPDRLRRPTPRRTRLSAPVTPGRERTWRNASPPCPPTCRGPPNFRRTSRRTWACCNSGPSGTTNAASMPAGSPNGGTRKAPATRPTLPDESFGSTTSGSGTDFPIAAPTCGWASSTSAARTTASTRSTPPANPRAIAPSPSGSVSTSNTTATFLPEPEPRMIRITIRN